MISSTIKLLGGLALIIVFTMAGMFAEAGLEFYSEVLSLESIHVGSKTITMNSQELTIVGGVVGFLLAFFIVSSIVRWFLILACIVGIIGFWVIASNDEILPGNNSYYCRIYQHGKYVKRWIDCPAGLSKLQCCPKG